MDFFLCLLIAWYFVKNGSEDLVHAVRGTESPRSKRKIHRLKTGQPSPAGQLGDAISTYLADWIHDASTDARAKRQEIRERRAAKKAEKETAAGKAAGAGEDAVAGNTRTPDDRNEPEPTAAREAVRDDTPDGADAGGPEGASTGSGPHEQPPPAGDPANGFGLGYVAGRAEERERQRWRDQADQTPPRRPKSVQAQAERLDTADRDQAAPPPAADHAQDVLDVELVDPAADTARNASQEDGQQVNNAPEAKQDNEQQRLGADNEPRAGDHRGPAAQTGTELRDQQPLATVTPINTITGGSSLSTPTPTTIRTNGGETVDPQSAMTFADAVGAVGSGLVSEIETSIANLVARNVSGEPITHLQHMLEAAQQLEGNSASARRYFENHAQIQEVAQSDATVGGGEYLGIGK